MSINRCLPQRSRANVALAINFMLLFAGTCEKQQLLQLLDLVL